MAFPHAGDGPADSVFVLMCARGGPAPRVPGRDLFFHHFVIGAECAVRLLHSVQEQSARGDDGGAGNRVLTAAA